MMWGSQEKVRSHWRVGFPIQGARGAGSCQSGVALVIRKLCFGGDYLCLVHSRLLSAHAQHANCHTCSASHTLPPRTLIHDPTSGRLILTHPYTHTLQPQVGLLPPLPNIANGKGFRQVTQFIGS